MIDVSVVTLLSFLCIKYRNYICQQQHSISSASTPPNGDTGGDHISHPLSLLTHLSQYINRYIPRSIRFNSNMANSDSSSPHFLQTQHTFARVGACRGQYSQGLLAGNWMMWLLLLLSTVVIWLWILSLIILCWFKYAVVVVGLLRWRWRWLPPPNRTYWTHLCLSLCLLRCLHGRAGLHEITTDIGGNYDAQYGQTEEDHDLLLQGATVRGWFSDWGGAKGRDKRVNRGQRGDSC